MAKHALRLAQKCAHARKVFRSSDLLALKATRLVVHVNPLCTRDGRMESLCTLLYLIVRA